MEQEWPFRAVVADSFYGEDRGLRRGIQQLKVASVMALKPSHNGRASSGGSGFPQRGGQRRRVGECSVPRQVASHHPNLSPWRSTALVGALDGSGTVWTQSGRTSSRCHDRSRDLAGSHHLVSGHESACFCLGAGAAPAMVSRRSGRGHPALWAAKVGSSKATSKSSMSWAGRSIKYEVIKPSVGIGSWSAARFPFVGIMPATSLPAR